MDDKYILKIEINAFECQRCGHIWIPRVNMEELKNKVKTEPMICPACKTPYWRTKRKNKKNGEKNKMSSEELTQRGLTKKGINYCRL